MNRFHRGVVPLAILFSAISFLSGVRALNADPLNPPYRVLKTMSIGGEGRWDYLTVDPNAQRLYVPRSTHVQVIDLGIEKVTADWPDTDGVHGVAIRLGKFGFTSNGKADSVSVFDLQAGKKLRDIKAGSGPDAIICAVGSDQILVCNHKGGTLTLISPHDKTDDVADLPIGGTLEFIAADLSGHAFINVEDKNEVVEVDTKAVKVLNRWPITGGEGPTGLAIDVKNHRLFIGCAENQKLIVMDSTNGKILATLDIGKGCDGVAFDPVTGSALAACGEGTLAVIQETAPGKFEIVQTVATKRGARTIALDPESHYLYLPTAEFEPAEKDKRPAMKPGTFQILVVGRSL